MAVSRPEMTINVEAGCGQQPFPNLIWRADMSILYDLEGGILVQPGVRWRPRDDFQLDLYANILDSDGGNDDIRVHLKPKMRSLQDFPTT